VLSISDTLSTPVLQQNTRKYHKNAGYPAVEIGNTQTGVLVGGRYQVKVISRAPSFTASDREAWLEDLISTVLTEITHFPDPDITTAKQGG